ncbi:purple acid phosphatase family protein [Pectinatus haikarae]|uniref:Calcineurin-like phosphoesterase domain-containing protein n=1 Tax=Pectinatus haikarae TaxID=349096 RepID=A0ABT9Y602_9FIRM|nr:metallophosphoesterase family protein [Pectinatus haikarae]MDQ0202574.1 hypothetical protein [Pectinatus haikarae]
MKRRDFLKWLSAGFVLTGAGLYTFVPGTRQTLTSLFRRVKAAVLYRLADKAEVFNLRQIITADSTAARTIMWQSEADEKDAVLEYRLKNTFDTHDIKTENKEFTDDRTTTYIHTALITDLQPGKIYEYRVGYNEKRSDWHDFSTAGADSFKAMIFPDSQSSDYTVWGDTAQAAWKSNPDAQFFINMGDLVDNGEDHNQWNAWFDAVGDIIQTIPAAPIMGNHETYNLEWKVRMPAAYLQLFSLPGVASPQYQNQYYSFDYGNVHFTVLNTQIAELAQFQPDLLEDELAWLKSDMADTKQKWKVILMHKDVLQYGFQKRPEPRQEGFSDEGKVFMPLFDQYNVDVVLTGHLHTYRNRGHIRNFRRDGSGPLYIITGVAGDVRYPDLWKRHALDQTIAPQPETDNYMIMTADQNTLTFSSFLPTGEKIDTAAVTKYLPFRQDRQNPPNM